MTISVISGVVCDLLLQEAFEAKFDSRSTIPTVNATRWNSLFLELSKINTLSHVKLCALLDETGHSELKLAVREQSYLCDFVNVLKPFYQATQLTQGEKVSADCCGAQPIAESFTSF